MAKIKKILTEPGMNRKIATYFGVSTQCVRNALKFYTRGPIPDAIRAEALRRGAVIATFNVPIILKEENKEY